MNYEKLERLRRMMEPFEKASKMSEIMPAAVRYASAGPAVNPVTLNLNRINELTVKLNLHSSSWKMNEVHCHDFPVIKQLSPVHQLAMEFASGLSKSIQVSNHASTKFLDSFRASSLVVSKAVLEFTERNRNLSEKINEWFKLLPEAFLVLADHGWYLNLEFELSLAVQLLQMLRGGKARKWTIT